MAALSRRRFLASAVAATAGVTAATSQAGLALAAPAPDCRLPPRWPVVLPKALGPGATLGIVSPANATYEATPFELTAETLEAMGYKLKFERNVRARWGQFAGSDADRAAAVNAMFADHAVDGILAFTGGSGCTRLLDKLDYELIRANPKVIGGFSDITALINAIHARTGMVTFHSPVASSEWNPYSRDIFERMVCSGEALTLRNPAGDRAIPVQKKFRTRTIASGRAQGHLIGGNLTVLTTLAGTPYWPRFDGAVLFIEDINEYIYRVDRALAHLKQAGAFQALAGVVIGQFTDCKPGEGYGTLTLEEVFADYFGTLGIPVFSGAQFGHVAEKMTLPVGAPVEIDAERGELRLLAPVVRN